MHALIACNRTNFTRRPRILLHKVEVTGFIASNVTIDETLILSTAATAKLKALASDARMEALWKTISPGKKAAASGSDRLLEGTVPIDIALRDALGKATAVAVGVVGNSTPSHACMYMRRLSDRRPLARKRKHWPDGGRLREEEEQEEKFFSLWVGAFFPSDFRPRRAPSCPFFRSSECPGPRSKRAVGIIQAVCDPCPVVSCVLTTTR